VGVQSAPGQARVTTEVTTRRLALASPRTATVLGVVVLVLVALSIPLAGLLHQLTILNIAPAIPFVLVYAAVGVVVARRQPRNPIGWILVIFVVLIALSTDGGYYAVAAFSPGHRGLPLAAVAVLLKPLWVPAAALFPLVILLFPDGRLMSRRWRRVLWAYAGLFGCVLAVIFARTIAAVAGHAIRLDSSGDVTTAGPPAGAVASAATVLVLASIGVICLSFVAHQVLSRRRAAGERRQQLKWLAWGSVIALVCGVVGSTANSAGVSAVILGAAALPVSIGIGILKYRLYEIDRIISRTLAYAIITGLLVGVYAGLVLLTTQVFRVHTPVAVAASTLAAAALFNPVRQRVQNAVDRRFNRARYDADQTVAAFAARLKDAVDLDSVRDDLARVVHQALEPAHVSVWTSQRD
jgi:hypothetical protein